MSSLSGPEHFPAGKPLPPAALKRIEQCAFALGETYDSYLVADSDRDYFFSSGRRGVIGFRRWGLHVLVVGGLLAEPENREQLLREFLKFIRSRWWVVTFFSLDQDACELFRRHGFRVSKLGEEPIVMLDQTQWRGKDYEWLRRQENYCLRQQVTLREVDPEAEGDDYRSRLVPELAAISRDHLAATVHGCEMRYFVGQWEPLSLGRRRLFVAATPRRIEAFVVLNPCRGGAMWAIEIFRRRKDAVRGILPFAMLQTLRRLQAERVRYASLSLVPWVRCDQPLEGDSWLFRSFTKLWWRLGNSLYDVRGIYHFKSRFRPHYRPLYLASWPRTYVLTLVAIGFTWGLLPFNPLRWLRHWWRDRRDPSRQSLAEPELSGERTVVRLSFEEEASGKTTDADAFNSPAIALQKDPA
jgi:phosphatidylglycerol lysyltransferase